MKLCILPVLLLLFGHAHTLHASLVADSPLLPLLLMLLVLLHLHKVALGRTIRPLDLFEGGDAHRNGSSRQRVHNKAAARTYYQRQLNSAT